MSLPAVCSDCRRARLDRPAANAATSSKGHGRLGPSAGDRRRRGGAAQRRQRGRCGDRRGLTLGVVDQHNSGIGGGCFILIRRADGKLVAIDGRETAPAKATRDMYLARRQAAARTEPDRPARRRDARCAGGL